MFREDILFSVNPHMFISFLRTVKNLREISTVRAILIKHLLVENLVRMRELVTILTILYLDVQSLHEAFDAAQITFANL